METGEHMRKPIPVRIAGFAARGPAPDLNAALDEMIYDVTSRALTSAEMTIDDISGSCMAASDLNDGRAISTMTLTGSTGSFRKSEMRICNDALAAVQLGWAEVASGASEALMVCSWSKLSDADPAAILPLAIEPALHRALHFHPGAIVQLRASAQTGQATVTAPRVLRPVDTAAAVVLVPDGAGGRGARLTGFGASMGPYLLPHGDVLTPVRTAVVDACTRAGRTPADLRQVHVVGMHEIDNVELADAFGVPESVISRQADRDMDLGYAAGLVGLIDVLAAGPSGPAVVVSGGGLAYENAHAVVVEVS
jgi:hypothetical protein